ncbi:hypothetical protein [Paenibacillus periandrae]|uniref:immunity protein TriTu family protein n=1 Tax=Paenibacillus periandrae TaxID=1761741 RepID=UPI001F089D6A|nr:hypothetical protein [Paenibacillus periandrae]
MIRQKFKNWIEGNNDKLLELFISIEYVNHANTDESLIPNPSTGIIHESYNCLGQVTVWKSRQMEYEVLNKHTEELIFWRYIEELSDEPNFDEILRDYFHILQTGLKS